MPYSEQNEKKLNRGTLMPITIVVKTHSQNADF